MTVGSLFAGIGGIDAGFERAGFSITWAIERDPICFATYENSFPRTQLIRSDIQYVHTHSLPKADILLAGFPCQPFSIAGKQRGFDDRRGNCFYEICRFVSVHRPRFVFLENVANLLNHDGGKTFQEIFHSFAEMDYSVRYRILRASEYGGIPQIRDRVYIIAFREQADCDRFQFPERIGLSCSIEDVLKRKQEKKTIYYYSKEDEFYQFAERIVVRNDSIYRVYHSSIKMTHNHMCPTLTASMGLYDNQVPLVIDDYGLRKLTVSECLAFQGFSEKFRFARSTSLKDAYKMVGNSVCVPVIDRLATQIARVL